MKNRNDRLVTRLRMLQMGQTEQEFAEKCGLKFPTLRKYLTKERWPQSESFAAIARSCNVPLEWIIEGLLPTGNEMTQDQVLAFFALDPEVIKIEKYGNNMCPVVKTYRTPSGANEFWCIHCMTFHSHGEGEGHREAHCIAENSPFHRYGVILDVSYEKRPSDKKSMPPLICPQCSKYYSRAFNACSCGFINKKRESLYPNLQDLYQRVYLIGPTKNIINMPQKQDTMQEKVQISANSSISEDRKLFENGMNTLFASIKQWRAAVYGADAISCEAFCSEFKQQFPGFEAWLQEQATIKNPEERWIESIKE